MGLITGLAQHILGEEQLSLSFVGEFLLIMAGGSLVGWFFVYLGPLGIGWTGRDREYVYPPKVRASAGEEQVGRASQGPRLSRLLTWRLITAEPSLMTLGAFVLAGWALGDMALLTTIGILVALAQAGAMVIVWKQLEKRGRGGGLRW